MYLPATYTGYLCVPVYAPPGVDPTQYEAMVALVPVPDDGTAAPEPADGDYLPAAWIAGEAALHTSTGQWPTGTYTAWVRVVIPDGVEDPRLPAGRVRVGDPLP